MQFTPFIFDVLGWQVRSKGNFSRPNVWLKGVYVPPFPTISGIVLQVFRSDGKTPVAAGTEVQFAGWAQDVDPYVAVTNGSGQLVTTNLAGTHTYTSIACLSRFRSGQLPSGYPPIGNPVYIDIPDFNNQGACRGMIQIPESQQTIAIAINSGVCVQAQNKKTAR
jgi:hypothetical protein